VLHRPIQRDLVLQVLAPWNWPKLLSWHYGRGDLADAYYDRHIFDGRTFGEMPMRRPLIQLNATDISLGSRFSFVQAHFDRLCSDLSAVSVSRGVAASSAFPVAFSPLTLKNYPSETCHYETPTWVVSAMENDLEVNPQLYDRARSWASYEDPARKYIHLSDGGLADNIGLRGPMLGLTHPANPLGLIEKINTSKIRRIVLIVVDAKPGTDLKHDESARPPGIFSVLNAAATNPMENYSADTVKLARQYVQEWNRDARDEKLNAEACVELAGNVCGSAGPGCEEALWKQCFDLFGVEEDPAVSVVFYRSHVRFDAAKEEDRDKLKRIGTSLSLPAAEVGLLVDAGAEILRNSEAYRCLMRAIGEPGTVPAPGPDADCPGDPP
jgi:NTE family protein